MSINDNMALPPDNPIFVDGLRVRVNVGTGFHGTIVEDRDFVIVHLDEGFWTYLGDYEKNKKAFYVTHVVVHKDNLTKEQV